MLCFIQMPKSFENPIELIFLNSTTESLLLHVSVDSIWLASDRT